MKIRCVLSTLFLFALVQPLAASDDSEKLDEILKRLQTLTERVDRLEKQVRALDRDEAKPLTHRDLLQQPTTLPIRFPGLQLQPAEVIRMQIESPKSLMKGIHERERVLRKRQFPADIYSAPLR